MEMDQDLSKIQNKPGYKSILKSVLKSQIQLLVQQLSQYGDEECCILTASLTDGSLSHLGSSSGKLFLESKTELKSQFLAHCLANQHTQNPVSPVYTAVLPVKVIKNNAAKSGKKSFSGERTSPYPLTKSAKRSNQGQGHDSSVTEVIPITKRDNPETSLDSVKLQNGNQSILKEIVSLKSEEGNQSVFQEEFVITEVTGNYSRIYDIASDHSEAGSQSVIVKQEPVDTDLSTPYMSGSWTPVLSDSQLQVTSESNSQENTGNQSVQRQNGCSVFEDNPLPDDPLVESCTCNVCGYTVINKANLTSHMEMHNYRPFVCDTCGLTFKFKDNLNQHKKRHEPGLSRNCCDVCGKQFFSSSELNRHRVKHTGERNYLCVLCDRRFSVQGALNRHHLVHTKQTLHYCKCNHQRPFIKKDNMITHIYANHSDEVKADRPLSDMYKTIDRVSREYLNDLVARKARERKEKKKSK